MVSEEVNGGVRVGVELYAVENKIGEDGAVSLWFCVEIHLVLEIITLFVETSEERDRLVASLQPHTIDDCDLNVQSLVATGARTDAVSASPLFSPMTLNSQSQPVCLNQRSSRFVEATSSKALTTFTIVREGLEAGLKVFARSPPPRASPASCPPPRASGSGRCPRQSSPGSSPAAARRSPPAPPAAGGCIARYPTRESAARLRINGGTILGFLDKVEQLNGVDLDKVASEMSSKERFALGLNLYHTLFIHAVLVFGHPQSHEQWKSLSEAA
ncbi:hypothetical protein PF008_g7737 [Phytophthora fragariae]|uniref:DUF547 domain-containing protein n=1 Tax=Phytophthora fragariae TaxID=53985 RepID=A0A6G0S3B9_9STRA|nr:hypothetical protein PF008_g7737 [Phytophthora fragariae]